MVIKKGSHKPFYTIILLLVLILSGMNSKEVCAQDESQNSVRIGLMLSQDPEIDTTSMESLYTVQYLVQKVNSEGGIDGKKIELYYKSGDGDWGISSKKSVELIFDDEVSAIIGSLDGRNAHLTQMAITKAEVVYIATRSTDPTLSEINIPWFFRVIPSDKQQAEILVSSIFKERGLNNIAVIHSDDYDYKMAANTFNRLASEKYRYSIQSFEFNEQNGIEESGLISVLKSAEVNGVVIFSSDSSLKNILSLAGQMDYTIPYFLPLTDQNVLSEWKYLMDISYLCPQIQPDFDQNFIQQFNSKFNRDPGLIAAYSYDGLQILIDSIKKSGVGRMEIREKLKSVDQFHGLSGLIGFEDNGDIIHSTTVCKL